MGVLDGQRIYIYTCIDGYIHVHTTRIGAFQGSAATFQRASFYIGAFHSLLDFY